MRSLKQFRQSQEGATFVIVAFSILALVGAIGTAVDVGRGHMVRTKLQNSLDAAGLAAGASGSTNQATLEAIVTKYTNINFAGGTLGATITSTTTTLSANNTTLTINAYASVPTTFMKVFGNTSIALHASTEVTRSNKGLELALVIDTTGSMDDTIDASGLSKLQQAKNASTAMINSLFGNSATATNLWVGIVPFSQAVNIGAARTSWLSINPTTLNWGSSSWGGCVDARWTGNDVTAATPITEPFYPYYYPDDNTNNWISTSTNNSTICSNSRNCTCANYGPCGTTVSGNTATTITCTGSSSQRGNCTRSVVTTSYDIDADDGPNLFCPANAITPMTNVKATIETAVGNLTATGGTHIPIGLVWGWRLLDQGWRGLWGGTMDSNGLPLNYNTPLMLKSVVLMTDGLNTMYTDSQDRTAYGYLSQGRLGTTSDIALAQTNLDSKLSTICTAMKAQGIIIYTVLYNVNNANTETLLRNCASQPDYYFKAPDNATLQSAFQAIGASLANLRISK